MNIRGGGGYHRLRGTTAVRRKLKIARLGDSGGGRGRCVRQFLKAVKKWWSKHSTVGDAPFKKMMAAFHEGYVRVMMKLEEEFRRKTTAKVAGAAGDGRVWELACGDRVDDRVFVELYSKLLASRSSGWLGSTL
ncbi:hypothetical protein LINGRAHAP2_LOCUS11653 [Linum grandiflorum]